MRDSTMSRKKHDTTPVAEAAELAHGLLGEDDAKPLSETRADWIEILADTPAPDSRHIFSPAVGNLVCERIAAGETLNKIASEPGMPSRSTIDRWCTARTLNASGSVPTRSWRRSCGLRPTRLQPRKRLPGWRAN